MLNYARYKITIEYCGTKYFGWQKQENVPTIQGELDKVISKFLKENIQTYGASRTDVGVHAFCQIAHFDLYSAINIIKIDSNYAKFIRSINFFLQDKEISILSIEKVELDFHARFSAKQKTYLYKIINRPAPSIMFNIKAWHIPKQLDINLMQSAALQFIGKKDFKSFAATELQQKSTIRNIIDITIIQNILIKDQIDIYFTGKSFLHKMIRNITGTLVACGLNKISINDIDNIFKAKNRTFANVTAPACGLYLANIQYE
ncbi:MAG: tRNA pseudouridine(38-40) synthase TruA [Rickettsiales bacterium]